jgi:hypothetical protein
MDLPGSRQHGLYEDRLIFLGEMTWKVTGLAKLPLATAKIMVDECLWGT